VFEDYQRRDPLHIVRPVEVSVRSLDKSPPILLRFDPRHVVNDTIYVAGYFLYASPFQDGHRSYFHYRIDQGFTDEYGLDTTEVHDVKAGRTKDT
jgi:hypothetical protein